MSGSTAPSAPTPPAFAPSNFREDSRLRCVLAASDIERALLPSDWTSCRLVLLTLVRIGNRNLH